jgi:3-(3-hydroxy-phenyl)propionate hydroxylase
MCQGIRDAGNLAWKLHQVVSGRAPESLLATYEEERRPNVVATTQLAKECGLIISERNFEKAKIRDAEIAAATAGLGHTIIRQDLIPPFAVGFIESDAPLSGRIFPQPLVMASGPEEVLMDDLLLPGFHLVVLANLIDVHELAELSNAAFKVDVEMVVLHEDRLPEKNGHSQILDIKETTSLIKDYLTASSCIGAIVRPDHYVYCGIANVKNALSVLTLLAAKLRIPD